MTGLLSFDMRITEGKEYLEILPKFLDSMQKNKSLNTACWGIIGEHMIKHTTNPKKRGILIQTFKKLGLDLSKFATNTERIPNAHAMNLTELAKGLREFILPEGNKIKLNSIVDSPQRMFSDILSDKRAPMAEFLALLLIKAGAKPKDVQHAKLR